jgi:hypothetical protein
MLGSTGYWKIKNVTSGCRVLARMTMLGGFYRIYKHYAGPVSRVGYNGIEKTSESNKCPRISDRDIRIDLTCVSGITISNGDREDNRRCPKTIDFTSIYTN